MSARDVRLVAQPLALVGESVRMDGRDVLWLDPPNRRLLRWFATDGSVRDIKLSRSLWSLGQRPDGTWLGAGENRLYRVDIHTGTLVAGPEAPLEPGCRFNDMTVDAQGGVWVGSMHRGLLASRGGIFHAPDISAPVIEVAAGLGVANGMAFVEGGRTLFVVDTLNRTLIAYALRQNSVGLDEPVVVADFLGTPGKPDGLAIAPDGAAWVAMWGGGCVVRLAANGAVDEVVSIPASHVGSLCFDGDGYAYVSSSRARLSHLALQANPGSGGLFQIGPS